MVIAPFDNEYLLPVNHSDAQLRRKCEKLSLSNVLPYTVFNCLSHSINVPHSIIVILYNHL